MFCLKKNICAYEDMFSDTLYFLDLAKEIKLDEKGSAHNGCRPGA